MNQNQLYGKQVCKDVRNHESKYESKLEHKQVSKKCIKRKSGSKTTLWIQ